ncbi:methyl-CpG-binding domain-containing protein 11-like [Phoenix dactylifera]|uniref:Methyl-CpG-binding domain-containing protein 11-like n=1 Tax=Phoenix dactylifera TaxID=42345 RepID=A0A8B8ZFI2_PHODC|nr:methyl-CpG-binding domain-containing protein 11-like [Phoenix dactylifera]
MAANEAERKVAEESPAEKERGAEEVVDRELTAPPGWRKKLMPKKVGTPRRNDVVFISPNGEEIKNKKQLEIFLRLHPENPPSSEFDWGTGQTPRRSARINEKMKAAENPEGEKSRKRERKASSKKTENEKKANDSVTEGPAAQEDAKVEAEDATVEGTGAVDEKVKADGDGDEKSKEEFISAETALKEGAENIGEKTEELEESSKVIPADTDILPPPTDSAEQVVKESKVPEEGSCKDKDAAVPVDAPVNPDDGQLQPETSPELLKVIKS